MKKFIPTDRKKARCTYNVLASDKQYIKEMSDKYDISEAEIGGQMLHAFIESQKKMDASAKKTPKQSSAKKAKKADTETEVKVEKTEKDLTLFTGSQTD